MSAEDMMATGTDPGWMDPFAITEPGREPVALTVEEEAELILPEPAYDPLGPAEGISLESWAALDAAAKRGNDLEDLLRGAGIDHLRWLSAAALWERRMTRDTTWVVASIRSRATEDFVLGMLSSFATEASLARLDARLPDLKMPVSIAEYYELLYAQADATARGDDVIALLQAKGYTLVDWTDLAVFVGYTMSCLAPEERSAWREVAARVRGAYEAKLPRCKIHIDPMV